MSTTTPPLISELMIRMRGEESKYYGTRELSKLILVLLANQGHLAIHAASNDWQCTREALMMSAAGAMNIVKQMDQHYKDEDPQTRMPWNEFRDLRIKMPEETDIAFTNRVLDIPFGILKDRRSEEDKFADSVKGLCALDAAIKTTETEDGALVVDDPIENLGTIHHPRCPKTECVPFECRRCGSEVGSCLESELESSICKDCCRG